MATTESHPGAHRVSIQRSRSARLADQAATAALYVTHPEHRLNLREPVTFESQLFKDPKATGSLNLSHASASAALAHARSLREGVTPDGPSPGGFKSQDTRTDEAPVARPSAEGYKAAITAVRDRRAITTLPPVATGFKYDISTTSDQVYDIQRESLDRDKALLAATGALRLSRQRADSAPSKPAMAPEAPYAASAAGSVKPVPEVEDPLAHIDSAVEASRIHHRANANAQLYTEHPSVGLEEQDRKNVLRAAAISMARDMYEAEGKEDVQTGEPSAALHGAQRGVSRMRSQRTAPKADPTALKQAIKVQEAAQQRAAEKLAKLNEPTYQEYYGVEPHAARPTLAIRRRRASVDSDTSAADAERSRQIRHQMSSLRSRLNAVDEQRTQDRADLMEAARRNVSATIQDMEMRMYHETGRPTPAMQKEWDEVALERTQRDIQEREPYPDRVNIGADRYIDMADVEAVARSRLQPTFDEITDRAEKERARDLEARLDAEERERYEAIARERELETRAEEKRLREIQKQQMKEKATGEKTWLWRRKSKRTRDTELPAEDYHAADGGPGAAAPAPQPEVTPEPTTRPVEAASQAESAPKAEAPEVEAPQPEAPQAEAPQVEAPQAEAATTEAATQAEAHPVAPPAIIDTTQPQPAEEELKIVEPEAAGEERPPLERRQSRLKSWFSRVGRQSNGTEHESLRKVEGEGAGGAGTGFAGGAALAETDSRGAALRSHPVTGNDLATMQQRMSVDEGSLGNEATRRGSSGVAEQNGEKKPSRLRSSFMKIVSGGQDNRTNGVSKLSDRRRASEAAEGRGVRNPEGSNASTATKEELRESAADHGLPAPPAIGKPTTNGSRGSRFSEDL